MERNQAGLTTPRKAKVVRDTMAQLVNMAKSMHLHRPQILKNSDMLKVVMEKLDKYRTQYNDEAFMKTLSHPEQQALIKNAQALATTMKDLQDEINFLDLGKYPDQLATALNYLEEAYMLFNYLLVELIGESGEIAYQKLSVIKQKNFGKADYKTQLRNLEIEFDVLITDISNELSVTIETSRTIEYFRYALKSLVMGWEWFKLEIERAEKAETQAYNKIEIPEEIKPEKPKSPEDEKEDTAADKPESADDQGAEAK